MILSRAFHFILSLTLFLNSYYAYGKKTQIKRNLKSERMSVVFTDSLNHFRVGKNQISLMFSTHSGVYKFSTKRNKIIKYKKVFEALSGSGILLKIQADSATMKIESLSMQNYNLL